jgi:histidine ammonia-lyase
MGRGKIPARLQRLLDDVRRVVPPVDADRVLGPELAALAAMFTAEVFKDDLVGAGAVAK